MNNTKKTNDLECNTFFFLDEVETLEIGVRSSYQKKSQGKPNVITQPFLYHSKFLFGRNSVNAANIIVI